MILAALLRYNSRHRLYFPGDGRLPQLNPISWSSHAEKSRKRTKDLHEPLWAFRLRQRLFADAGRQRCGRRDDAFAWNRGDGPSPDTWDRGPDGFRTCSYCGSIHFDDLLTICQRSLTDARYSVDPSDKFYKVYLRQPGVVNASQGAIKFYKNHSPPRPTEAQHELFRDAVRASRERFEARRKTPAAAA